MTWSCMYVSGYLECNSDPELVIIGCMFFLFVWGQLVLGQPSGIEYKSSRPCCVLVASARLCGLAGART